MSEVKVNKISPKTACGTVTMGDSGDAFTIPSGVTITNNGTQVGFGRTGTVDWVTTVQTSTITAATGKGYFVNTTSGEITANLPAGAAGSIVAFKDYANTWDTNQLIVTPNGSEKIGGNLGSIFLNTESQSITLVYIDATKGWLDIHDSTANVQGGTYIVATGGTPCAGATCGDYKIHSFTGPGTLCISAGGGSLAKIDYLVVAGGGAGGNGWRSGGGGAGGYRESVPSPAAWTGSPVAFSGNARPVSIAPYSIVVGGAGALGPTAGGPGGVGGTGGVSTFSDITSAGGGGGALQVPGGTGLAGAVGGSGGGSGGAGCSVGCSQAGGAGDTPPTTPPQGNPGGYGGCSGGPFGAYSNGGGGGGATAAGADAKSPLPYKAPGGAGGTTCISGTPTAYGGGGGGAGYHGFPPGNPEMGAGGVGGGGYGGGIAPPGSYTPGEAATTNTGGGGGGGSAGACGPGGAGGSGIVILRYKFQN